MSDNNMQNPNNLTMEDKVGILNDRIIEGKHAKNAYDKYFAAFLELRKRSIVDKFFNHKMSDDDVISLKAEAEELVRFNNYMTSIVNTGIMSANELAILSGDENG